MENGSITKKTLEGLFTEDEIYQHNCSGYNIYFTPNGPDALPVDRPVNGTDINTFSWVFVDMDLKDNIYPSKDSFIETVLATDLPPTKIVDSGNGVHAYWRVSNLDAMSYLRFQRRLTRLFKTDEAVGKLFQLMRYPGTVNTKYPDKITQCELVAEADIIYTAEEFDKLLPSITLADEQFCQTHYNQTHNIDQVTISDEIPAKFGQLLKNNSEAKEIWSEPLSDRSKGDFRLGHLMFANGFTKDEAMSVLAQSAKALARAPVHRVSYAQNIVDKIWTFETASDTDRAHSSVKDILQRSGDNLKGQRLPCWKYVDNTEAGFRIGQVMGLVAGSGVGKTTMALNIFLGFVESNPELTHFFVPLEQPEREIAERWAIMCGEKTHLHDKVQVLSNYDNQSKFRDLSLEEIKQHIMDFKRTTGKQVGCVVIDHIGVLKNDNKLGQDEGVKGISKAMKAFAEETKTFLIMQSQTSRDKAGIGDLELNKDAAFGTSVFENFVDFLIALWQPLKRVYNLGAPTVIAYKFCKIRNKNQLKDVILEDTPYSVFFDPNTQLIRELTQSEEAGLSYWVSQATNKRKQDRKTEVVNYNSIKWVE
jgi:KaiC/GvpD/RAD55 family RecA-like ATPase